MPVGDLTRYACGNVSFEACDEALETLIVGFRAVGPPGSLAPCISLSREPLNARDSLRMHADRKLLQVKTEAPDLDLLASRAFTVQGRAAIEMRVQWASPCGIIEQTIVLIDADDEETTRRVTVLNLTSHIDDADASREIFSEMLESVRFGEESAPVLPFPSPRSEPPMEPPLVPFIPMPGHDRRCDRS